MKFWTLILLIALMAMSVAGQRGCGRLNTDCQNSLKCCSSWCHAGKCKAWGTTEAGANQPNPCGRMTCPRGRCVLEWLNGAVVAKCMRTW